MVSWHLSKMSEDSLPVPAQAAVVAWEQGLNLPQWTYTYHTPTLWLEEGRVFGNDILRLKILI